MKPCITAQQARTIVAALQDRWGEWLRPSEQLTVVGEADDDEVRISLAVHPPDRATELRLEARMARRKRGPAVEETTWLLLDALDAWLGQVLESDRLDRPPLDWTTTAWGTATIHVRGAIRDLRAEQAAADLLGPDADRLDEAIETE